MNNFQNAPNKNMRMQPMQNQPDLRSLHSAEINNNCNLNQNFQGQINQANYIGNIRFNNNPRIGKNL